MRRTVDWLVKNRPETGGEAEIQLGDPFDYAKEDQLIRAWKDWRNMFPRVDYPVLPPAHMYRHPKKPNEPWTRPDHWASGRGERPK